MIRQHPNENMLFNQGRNPMIWGPNPSAQHPKHIYLGTMNNKGSLPQHHSCSV